VNERADIESCCGMTVAQVAALEVLQAEGPMRLGTLGRRLGVTPSTLSRNLSRLEESGAVSRVRDDGDGRAFHAVLTAAGRRAAGRVQREGESFAVEILERLPPARRRRVVDALEELLVAVREATESCCGGAFDHLMREFPGSSQKKGRCIR
jgi:DNA-binding MarR family transcriptional regulator